jgi:hypothetical protein
VCRQLLDIAERYEELADGIERPRRIWSDCMKLARRNLGDPFRPAIPRAS